MLTIGKLGASVDQLGYYEQQVAQGMEDYFAGRGEAPGRWAGHGCRGLGVSGQVDRDGFTRAMAGCDPRTGERLRPGHGQARVAAFDLTFSAPKSVSVLFAIADEQTSAALLAAHERAVEAALAYVEREACFTRRGRNGVVRLRGEGFVAAAYRHRLSRAGDPQLHTHVVVANMTRAEGRWTTLEGHSLYEHVSAGGAAYRAVLRAEVREHLPWVSWRPAGRGLFEIAGVPEGVLREFSTRRVEIEERALALTGAAATTLSRERLQGIALQTRKAKEYGVHGERWRQEARARAAEHGLGAAEVERLTSRSATSAGPSEADVVRDVVLRLSGAEGLTAQHNTFAHRHALAEIACEFPQGAEIAQLERVTSRYLEHDSVVGLGRIDGERRFTTRELLSCERMLVDGAERRRDTRVAVLDTPPGDVVVVGTGEEALSHEQAAASRALMASGDGVSILQALAGTGKTRVLAALAAAYQAAGYQVLGVAPTGRAARELAETAGIEASTIHSLVAHLERTGDLTARTVILLDEAGMAPTRPSAALLAHAQRAGAKVIAVGDSGQLPSVTAGGWFHTLAGLLGGPQLRQVMRQRDPAEREALAALHDGEPERYLRFKCGQDALTVHACEDDALGALIGTWNTARQRHGLSQAVMIARDNATRALLNERARALLLADGTIDPTPTRIAAQEFHVGDRVIARRNDRHREVDNGTLARIAGIDLASGDLRVITDTGQRRILDAAYAADHLELAYALTGHGAQGASVEWAGVAGRPGEFTREWAYTALSRARDRTEIHVIAQPTPTQCEREQYAPSERDRSAQEALDATGLAMARRESEPLAIEGADAEDLRLDPRPAPHIPLQELPEAGAERAARETGPSRSSQLNWWGLRRQRDRLGRARGIER